MKLHRCRLRLHGRWYTVVTLRPGTEARFSTNFYHDTWHILSDWHGARLLGRLLWGLAYQRVAGTLVLIDQPFLDPNPFDAEPADPIALVPAHLTTLTSRAARELRHRLPCTGTGDGTVRWHTYGLDGAIAARRANHDRPVGAWRAPWIPPRGFHERMDRVGGLVTFAATPSALKEYATYIHNLGAYHYHGIAHAEIDWPNGEVQVFRDYGRRVSAARVARREILSDLANPPSRDGLNPLLWQRSAEVRHQRRRRSRTTAIDDATRGAAASGQSNARPWPQATPYGRIDNRKLELTLLSAPEVRDLPGVEVLVQTGDPPVPD
jgi:hypothetical protein